MFSFTGGYTYDFNNIPSADLTSSANLAPDAPALYNADGSLNFSKQYIWKPFIISQPLQELLYQFDSSMVASYLLAKG